MSVIVFFYRRTGLLHAHQEAFEGLRKGVTIMAGKKTAVFGIYQNTKQAERTVDDLLAARFSNDDISVLLPDKPGTRDFAHEKNTKAPEGTAAGVTAGGAIGGTLGLLAGIGLLAIPGLGPFIAAGPIVAAWRVWEPVARSVV
jgi:hypothetical protein